MFQKGDYGFSYLIYICEYFLFVRIYVIESFVGEGIVLFRVGLVMSMFYEDVR